MKTGPKLIVFDIIETVMSIESMRPRFEAIGQPGHMLETWFAASLRDAFSIAITGRFEPFAAVLHGALDQIVGNDASDHEKKALIEGMKELKPQPDAAQAFAILADAGYRIAALSNGAAAVTAKLLGDAGLDRFVERVGSVDDVQASKPKPEVYLRMVRDCSVDPGDACLVAAHAWDVNGAMAAGLKGAFIARGSRYPSTMSEPDLAAETLVDAALALARLKV